MLLNGENEVLFGGTSMEYKSDAGVRTTAARSSSSSSSSSTTQQTGCMAWHAQCCDIFIHMFRPHVTSSAPNKVSCSCVIVRRRRMLIHKRYVSLARMCLHCFVRVYSCHSRSSDMSMRALPCVCDAHAMLCFVGMPASCAACDVDVLQSIKSTYGLHGGNHHGPIYSVQRNPFNFKYFMTVGDWTAKVSTGGGGGGGGN